MTEQNDEVKKILTLINVNIFMNCIFKTSLISWSSLMASSWLTRRMDTLGPGVVCKSFMFFCTSDCACCHSFCHCAEMGGCEGVVFSATGECESSVDVRGSGSGVIGVGRSGIDEVGGYSTSGASCSEGEDSVGLEMAFNDGAVGGAGSERGPSLVDYNEIVRVCALYC